jgi:hypothetical protein
MTSTVVWVRRRTSALRFGPEGVRDRGFARWAAVLGGGAVTGGLVAVTAISAVTARRSTRTVALAVGIGAAGGVLAGRAIVAIRRRGAPVWMPVDEPDTALDLMQAVRARGVQADMIRTDAIGADTGQPPVGRHYALRYRAKDDRRVRAVLAEQQT